MATATKKVASTLVDILEDERMVMIMDRTCPIRDLVTEILNSWKFDLFTRRPGPAVIDGVFEGTDLDLACFMSALIDRKAVINIPTYKARRARTENSDQRVVSDKNRHGQVTGMTANKEAFSFSIRVNDYNVIETKDDGSEKVGAPRNFMLVDVTGKWHEGWQRIEFSPTARENDFLNDRKLWTGPTIVFKNFVHPNRWSAIFGSSYFLTKALIERLEEQTKFYDGEVKRLLSSGVNFPTTGKGAPKDWGESKKVGEEKSIDVDAFEAYVQWGGFTGTFPALKICEADLVMAADLVRLWRYSTIPQLRFFVRSVELAFFLHGGVGGSKLTEGNERMPGWIKNAEWERDYIFEGKRTKYNRLVLGQPVVGKHGLSMTYRIFKKKERVAAD